MVTLVLSYWAIASIGAAALLLVFALGNYAYCCGELDSFTKGLSPEERIGLEAYTMLNKDWRGYRSRRSYEVQEQEIELKRLQEQNLKLRLELESTNGRIPRVTRAAG